MSFADISQITTKCAAPFGFTEEERREILGTAHTIPVLTPVTPERNLLKHYDFIMKKELSLTLHLSTLIEYVKVSRIPRGLRVHLEPILCKDDPVFKERWHQILDKCSLDLMTLTIQSLQKEIKEISQEVHKLTQDMKEAFTAIKTAEVIEATKIELEKLQSNLLQKKLRKFKRDTQDYQMGRVYTWAQWRGGERRDTRRYYRPRDGRIRMTSPERQREHSRTDTSPAESLERSSESSQDTGSGVLRSQPAIPFLGTSAQGGDSRGDPGTDRRDMYPRQAAQNKRYQGDKDNRSRKKR
ncbi:uncharacterized protein LOC121399976 [Xenopus laevis]|uniref:Uncharacterized protein LOC121399976 n=1 Tax=Xenopus laevis TaxID=8355 RepID=A0A8J1M9E1_XENLA|nr:uncharacterized protein LOC121399976 [Xenopus laevis]